MTGIPSQEVGNSSEQVWGVSTSVVNEVVEPLFTAEPEVVDRLMEDIKTVFNDCDGIEWDYQGEALVIEIVDAPVVADDQIAVRRADQAPDSYTIYVHHGDVIAIVGVPDRSDTYEEIIAKAIDKLPD